MHDFAMNAATIDHTATLVALICHQARGEPRSDGSVAAVGAGMARIYRPVVAPTGSLEVRNPTCPSDDVVLSREGAAVHVTDETVERGVVERAFEFTRDGERM